MRPNHNTGSLEANYLDDGSVDTLVPAIRHGAEADLSFVLRALVAPRKAQSGLAELGSMTEKMVSNVCGL